MYVYATQDGISLYPTKRSLAMDLFVMRVSTFQLSCVFHRIGVFHIIGFTHYLAAFS